MMLASLRVVCLIISVLVGEGKRKAESDIATNPRHRRTLSAKFVCTNGPVEPAAHITVPITSLSSYERLLEQVSQMGCPLYHGHFSCGKTSALHQLARDLSSDYYVHYFSFLNP